MSSLLVQSESSPLVGVAPVSATPATYRQSGASRRGLTHRHFLSSIPPHLLQRGGEERRNRRASVFCSELQFRQIPKQTKLVLRLDIGSNLGGVLVSVYA